ncbi:MAG: hypothetical protein ETSY2_00545 [Candidatus Entotheonella gemina]|uniref:Cytochrome c-552/DMSO reductase-like haem-binding domain-containing protein n=3 Tax=Candidatus Entotheonella TaxID=93171 RepID=W4MHR8_9BACT|nr:MAG: hypothetical protein ETSY2_00545 [Candidatus Entotheonella gemina]
MAKTMSDTIEAKTPRKRKPHFFVTFSHWSMVLLLALSLLTGMRLGWGYLESGLGGPYGMWATLLNAIAPRGTLLGINLITLHVTLAFLFLLNTCMYAGYLFLSGDTRRLRFTNRDLKSLLTGLVTRQFRQNKRALWSANLLVYWIAFTFVAVLLVTGVALYREDWGLSQLLGGYGAMRLLHGFAAYLFLPYIILHITLQWWFGQFWSIFRIQWHRPHLKAGLIGLALSLMAVGGVYGWNQRLKTLTVPRITQASGTPVLDGKPHDPAWQQAQPVTIRTVKGINNPHDFVDVDVKALHDGQHIYFRMQWDDPDVSSKRFPLLKTAEGWKVLQTAMASSNEDVYYEDKLAVYITDVPRGGCAETCHVGVGPEGVPKGVHYTNGETGDVWHWKSVRTAPMGILQGEPGLMDDQYFRPPDPLPEKVVKRYKGGYHADPKSGGGYRSNFVKLDPEKPLEETYVKPIMLPPSNEIVPDPDPATSEHNVTWWIHEAEGIPYSEEADTYPVGTLIPNILIKPIEGDRADVKAQAGWHDGVWTLEIKRGLDTQSDYDVAFDTEHPVYLSVATFNRTQVRHSEHIRPIKVVLKE